MPISDFKIYRYELALHPGLTVRGTPLQCRNGFILKLTDDRGHCGFGETAPLPHVSTESPDIVLSQLKEIQKDLLHQNIPAGIEHLSGKLGGWINRPLSPSVRFGIESAVLTLKAAQEQKPLAGLLDDNYQDAVTVNGLLQGPADNILKDAEAMLAAGYSVLKLKVGDKELKQDIELVNMLAKMSAGRAILRIDANRAWDYQTALKFGTSIDYVAVEYLEEPLKDFAKTAELYHATSIPIAVDESLAEHSLKQIKSIDGIEVVVFKPTFIGGVEKLKQMVEEAKSYGLRAVLTSSFESQIGIRMIANLAASFSRHVAAGLDTGRWFAQDLIARPALIHGAFPIEQFQFNNISIDQSLLKEI